MKPRIVKLSLKDAAYISVGLLFILGRYPISWLLSSKRKIKVPAGDQSSTGQYIPCPSGNSLYVEADGPAQAQPIVIIHGLNSSMRQWYAQRAYFRNAYQLIFIDLPGHGRSLKAADLSIDAMAADLAVVLETLALKNPILYGHSLGGMVIMQYCVTMQKPDVKAIIVQHSTYTHPFKTCQFPAVMQFLQEPVIRPYLNFAKKNANVFRVLGRLNYYTGLSLILYNYLFFKGKQSPAQLRHISKISALCPPETVAEGLLKCLEFDVVGSLPKIEVPCLVIAAAGDRIVKPEAGQYIVGQVKNGTLLQVNGGHLSLIENEAEINHGVEMFLNQTLHLAPAH
ncbi:alpha/beta fold hydrolase [Pedobacter immunditicola]|uniref:alpha/beta fold hydrolase n=1 Tax=Pedobacter immunditicola TaxID=3133440 RepID=UPI00309DED4F